MNFRDIVVGILPCTKRSYCQPLRVSRDFSLNNLVLTEYPGSALGVKLT